MIVRGEDKGKPGNNLFNFRKHFTSLHTKNIELPWKERKCFVTENWLKNKGEVKQTSLWMESVNSREPWEPSLYMSYLTAFIQNT